MERPANRGPVLNEVIRLDLVGLLKQHAHTWAVVEA